MDLWQAKMVGFYTPQNISRISVFIYRLQIFYPALSCLTPFLLCDCVAIDKVKADNSNLSNGIASGGDNSEHKLRSYSRRSSKGRGSSISPRGSIKRPSIHPVESSRSTSPTRLPVESSRSTSPTRQSINMGLRE
jgi:hypothetical protein